MRQVKPKKALGQHFLTDLSVAARIAATIDDYKGVPVLEVGPGMGVLTRFLLDNGHDVKVAEIDTESVVYLNENFPDVIVAPFLLTAGTDARRFSDIADAILRFAPIDLNKSQFASIHNCNEHIAIQNIGQCVLFYQDFIRKI